MPKNPNLEILESELETQLFLDSLPGHLPPDEASQSRSLHILERAKAIAGCDPQ
jgi:hypothetical protein